MSHSGDFEFGQPLVFVINVRIKETHGRIWQDEQERGRTTRKEPNRQVGNGISSTELGTKKAMCGLFCKNVSVQRCRRISCVRDGQSRTQTVSQPGKEGGKTLAAVVRFEEGGGGGGGDDDDQKQHTKLRLDKQTESQEVVDIRTVAMWKVLRSGSTHAGKTTSQS